MRKLYFLAIVAFLFTSCSKSVEDEEMISYTPLVSGNKTIHISTTDQVECHASELTLDLEIILSEPLTHDAFLSFKVYEYDNGWNEIPGEFVSMEAGESYAKIETSCYLPDYVQCGQYTNWYSSNYKFVLDNATLFGGTWDYDTYNDGTQMITAYKYCLGGGWTDPNEPGGLH